MSTRNCPECLLPDDGDCACCDEVLQKIRLYESLPGPQLDYLSEIADIEQLPEEKIA
jgi:hypothetical protein